MAITKQSKPYEFLARWDHVTGALKGAHTQRFDGVYEDGVLLSGQPGKAMGVGEDLAFPLADILSQLQIDALAAVDAHLATIAERDATIATHAPALQALTAERDSALTRVAELQAQLAVSQADDLPAAIRAERDRRILGGVKVGAHWYHSDLQFQVQVLGMVIMGANLPSSAVLKTLDDGPQPATQQLVQQLFAATGQQMLTLHAIADAAIAACTPLDQIQWPATYVPA